MRSEYRYLCRTPPPVGPATVEVERYEDGRWVAHGELPVRLDLRNHSPDGFAWGYGGSGPSQLALAMCAHALEDDERALRVYQRFKLEIVARAPGDKPWGILSAVVRDYVEKIEEQEGP